MELIMMNAICNSAAPTGLNYGWDAIQYRGSVRLRLTSPPAYTLVSPNGLHIPSRSTTPQTETRPQAESRRDD